MIRMQSREIRFGDVRYPYHHGIDCAEEIVAHLRDIPADRYVVVIDSQVEPLHAGPIVDGLARHAPVLTVPLPAAERTKSLDLVGTVLELAVSQGMTRRSVVVAMGGGVVGNMAGLVSALAFRGVRLVHLPTTVIAAMDSVLSLKQAVNGRLGKNLVGTFHAPTAVLVDHRWLTTLPAREVRSGLCELVKNALAIAPDSTEALVRVAREDCRLSAEDFRDLVDLAIDPKLLVMADDPKERNRGLALEYGHTIGHAIELAAPGLVSHGEAVGIGMLCAADLAERLFGLASADVEVHRRLLGRIGVGPHLVRGTSASAVASLLRFDNKRGYLSPAHDEVPMILLDGIGRLRWNGTSALTPVPAREIATTLASVLAA